MPFDVNRKVDIHVNEFYNMKYRMCLAGDQSYTQPVGQDAFQIMLFL